jgi:uncharacterized protein (UPF0303 family)
LVEYLFLAYGMQNCITPNDMRKNLTILFSLFVFTTCAQKNDFLILKRKSRTVQMFFKGSSIEFLTIKGDYRNAVINDIKNDSIFLREYIVNRVPSTLGFFFMDTLGSYRYAYHYKQLYKFNKQHKKFDVNGSAAALLGGGTIITLASGVIYVADNKKFSLPLLATGAGLATLGYFWGKQSIKGITIGKNKYSLQYINISTKENESTKR